MSEAWLSNTHSPRHALDSNLSDIVFISMYNLAIIMVIAGENMYYISDVRYEAV